VWRSCTPAYRGGVWGPGRSLPRKKYKLRAEKVKFGAYFCVLLLFQHEIIVDSKRLGDLLELGN